jgi:hypothetical protein
MKEKKEYRKPKVVEVNLSLQVPFPLGVCDSQDPAAAPGACQTATCAQ